MLYKEYAITKLQLNFVFCFFSLGQVIINVVKFILCFFKLVKAAFFQEKNQTLILPLLPIL